MGRPTGIANLRTIRLKMLQETMESAHARGDIPTELRANNAIQRLLQKRRPKGTQPDSQKGRRDAAQQAKSDAKAAARAAFGKGLAVPELSTHQSPSTGPQEPVAQPEPPLPPEDRIDRDARKQAESDAAARERSRLESIRYLTACGVLHGHEGAARESAVRVSVHPIPIDAAPPSVPNENTDIRPPEAPKAPNTTVAVISPEEWERMKASVHR
jgi:hypothetical protein